MPLLSNAHPRNLGLTGSLAAFLLGFVATSSQIFLLREFNAHFYGNELTYGLVLASWLFWGGIGSLSASRWKWMEKHLALVYYAVFMIIALSLVGVRLFRLVTGSLPGELTGLSLSLALSALLCFLVSFPLGGLFVLIVSRMQGRVSEVYKLESLGATAAGLAVYFLLLPHLSTWQAASLIGGICSLLVFFFLDGRKNFFLLSGVLAGLIALTIFDLPSQNFYWKPYRLIASEDSRYGKLQVIQIEEQVSLYNNSSPVYSHPDPATAEESVHFALLQVPEAQRVLLIGGGAGGTLVEILKYPVARLDYVELDPKIIRLSDRFLPAEEKAALRNPRVHLIFQDGRAYLRKTNQIYDCILLSLPEPSTAQLNRFYTKEFFILAKKRLAPGGVFSFIVPSAEDYIQEELKLFLATVYRTLSGVFPAVEVIPGGRNIFLASSRPLHVDPEALSHTAETLGLSTLYFSRPFLMARLHPLRRLQLDTAIRSQDSRVNTDLAPVSFYFQMVLWSAHFRGIEAKALKFLSGVSAFWLLGLPLAAFLVVLAAIGLKKEQKYFPLVPLAVMGFTTIVTEITLLVWFQALYGYLYGAVAILLSVFMFGLFSGSWVSARRIYPSLLHLVYVEAGFLLLIAGFLLAMGTRPPAIFAFFILFFLGFLGGDLFIVSNSLYLQHKTHYGLGYGLDLLGSFGGALITSTLLIPLAGLAWVLKAIFLLNFFCLCFLLTGLRLRTARHIQARNG